MHKHYPIVIDKDPDSDYGMMVPDLPGCYTAGDTIADVLRQAVEAWETVAVIIPTDASKIRMPQPNPIHRFFRWSNQTTQVLR